MYSPVQPRTHDLHVIKFVDRVRKELELFSVFTTTALGGPATPRADGAAASAPAAPRTDVYAERDAMLKLDQLRAALGQGKKAEAKKGLESLIRTFPKTDAADEARDLLKTIK